MHNYVGQQLGDYRLLRLLGQGSFGTVYEGEHLYLKTHAAVKVLHTQMDQVEFNHFLAEARTIAALEHPHIVRILGFSIQERTPYLVMQLAQSSLKERFRFGRPQPIETILPFVQQAASGLQHAHTQQIMHLDIKPANLLLATQENVLLADFGLALALPTHRTHQTVHGFAGTIAYAAPEQFQNKPGYASDQYALGTIVYQWLTGMLPFIGGDLMAIGIQKLTHNPSPLSKSVPSISAEVERVVLQALATDPKQRFATVDAFAIALEQALDSPISVTRPAKSVTPMLPPLVASSPPSTVPFSPLPFLPQSQSSLGINQISSVRPMILQHLNQPAIPPPLSTEPQAPKAVSKIRWRLIFRVIQSVLLLSFIILTLIIYRNVEDVMNFVDRFAPLPNADYGPLALGTANVGTVLIVLVFLFPKRWRLIDMLGGGLLTIFGSLVPLTFLNLVTAMCLAGTAIFSCSPFQSPIAIETLQNPGIQIPLISYQSLILLISVLMLIIGTCFFLRSANGIEGCIFGVILILENFFQRILLDSPPAYLSSVPASHNTFWVWLWLPPTLLGGITIAVSLLRMLRLRRIHHSSV